jgi:hypothetical protein
MAKQKDRAANRGGGGRNREGSFAARGRANDSPTPASSMTLRINSRGQGGNQTLRSARTYAHGAEAIDEEEEGEEDGQQEAEEEPAEEEELPPMQPTARTTRAGRVTKQPHKYADDALDDEIELQVQTSPAKIDDDFEPSSPAGVRIFDLLPEGQSRRKPGRLPKNLPAKPQTLTDSPLQARTPFTLSVDENVYSVLSSLCASASIQIDLPSLQSTANPGAEEPYTAKFLTELYLVCYNGRKWQLCDLITDTWIRAFHTLRRKAERTSDERHALWRPNESLMSRRRKNEKGFEKGTPDYHLEVEDPELAPSVTSFDNTILSTMYDTLPTDNGACLMWADAMALAGDKLEKEMVRMKKYGQAWHPDLMHNMLCTTLRMVRRKLTLKIEEGTEGAWCKRYHEHSKHNQPCYRKQAYDRIRSGEDAAEYEQVDGAHEDDEDNEGTFAADVVAVLNLGEKRGFCEMGGLAEMGDPKRARMNTSQREAFEVDAEGDSG